MRFVDSNIFINWMKGKKSDLPKKEEIAHSGFILYQIQNGQVALTSSLVKEEVLIWLSRYKRSKMVNFLNSLLSYKTLDIIDPTFDDQKNAEMILGKYNLGYSDCLNLAIMIRLQIKEIYSTDKGFDNIKGIKRIFSDLKTSPNYKDFLSWVEKSL